MKPDTAAGKSARLKVMVVDDHPAFRMGMISLVNSQTDMLAVAETGNGRESVELYRRANPDVVLMDLRLPGMSGVEAIIALRREFPECRVIVLTTYDCDEDIYRACQSGAQSYLLKDSSIDDIAAMIRAVAAGEQRLPSSVAQLLARRLRREELTQRELDVLHCLVKAHSNKEIAAKLALSDETVKTHMKSLFGKLGVQDRTKAVLTAIHRGIVHLDE
jgi:two-component system NarL family response regulator